MKKSRHEPFSMQNVNPEGQGVGGSTGRSENVGQFFFRVGTKDKFNKCS